MKKLSLFFALLCVGMMGWAVNTPYCHEEMTVGGKTIYLTCKTVSAGNYQLKIESTETMTGLGGSFCYQNGVAGYQLNAAGHFNVAGDGKTITCDIESTSVPNLYTPLYVIFSEGGQKEYSWPSDVDWTTNCGETCSDAEKPTISAVAASDITYKSVVLTVTATDNVGVTRYIVKNGDTQIASSATSPVTVDGLSGGTTYNNIKVIARDACGNESDAFSVSSFTTETLTYCRYATGHLANPNFGDIYGRILVTIKKVDNSTIGVKVEPNNNGTKGIKYLNIIVNNVGHEYGNNDGSGDDLTGYFNISGLSSLDFNININFYCNTPNWTTQQFSVTEDQLCDESPVVLSEGSEYCGDYGVECDRHNGAYAYLKWETTEDGDVVITMVDGTGSTNARFRGNNGMGENLNGFTVLSGTGFAASEPASNYFTRVYVANGNTFKLQRKGGAVLPSPAKIRFASPAVEWYCTQDGDGYAWPTYEYTYGKTCPVISGYSVSASANNGTMGAVSAKVGDADVTNVDAGTTVRFTATANDSYEFVNWTKNDVVVSTNPVYDLEINENTYLTANFDYIRTTYCHTAVTSNEGKKFYLTLGSIGGDQYQIKYEGSSEATITGINDANFQINGVSTSWDDDGVDVPFSKANGAWTFDDSGYGTVSTTFELAAGKTWKDIYAWTHYMYFACEGMGQQTLTDAFPNRYRIAWNESCADIEAPVLAAPSASALNTTDVRLTLSATDNWDGTITYNVNYKPTGDTGDGVTITPAPQGASGQIITVDVEGLNTNTEYTFTVTASDGTYVSAAQSCSATPVGDTEAPVITAFTATPSYAYIDLAITATDDMGNNLTFTITYGTENTEVVGLPGVEVTKRINALPGMDYTFSVVATDAASHTSNVANANATTLTIPAAPTPTRDARLVYSIYSDAYTPVVAQDFWRSNYGGAAPLVENDYLLYQMSSNIIVWGNAAELGSIHPEDAFYTDGEHFGLDVSNMAYLHFDVWCDANDQLNTLNLNDNGVAIATTRTVAGQWVSFDVPLDGYNLADKQNLRFFKFHPFNSTNCLVAIDNVYFYAVPEDISFVDNGSNVDLIEAKHKHFVNATINRSFAANDEWYTLCLPFDLDAAKINEVFGNSTIAEMVGAEDRGSLIHLNFDYINEIKAGKAYLFKPGHDFAAGTTIEGVQIKNVNPATLKSTNTYMEFQGTFESILLNSDNQRFVGPENYLYSPAVNGTTMKAFRCYFTIPNSSPLAGAPGKRAKIVFGPQATTDIENVQDNVQCTKVLRDGQLYIIRDGRTYDAQGQLIK